MFKTDTKVLHIESTTVCNASCPQCSREDTKLYNDKKHRTDLTLKKCKELFSVDFIKNLNKMFMCGVFGDPASATDTLAIFRYFKKHNPNITLGMNTNGSIQNTKWWNELASIFTNELDYVVFSIDGLEDTNHIYRRNVNWHKVMNNMTTFINEGGKAHWDMLIFDHNKHQVDEAKQLAKTLGVSWFRSKVSKRFVTNPIKGLNPPKEFKLPNKNNINSIQCIALKDKSVYVSASGEILPCCWFGTLAFNRDGYATKLLNSKNWEMLEESWNKTPHFLCKETCGVNNDSKTIFELQWNDNIELETL